MHVPAADGNDAQHQTKVPRVVLDAAAGALAGAISRFIVGPLDVVKIRFQVQLEPIKLCQTTPTKLPSHYTGFINAFKTIVAEEGIRVSSVSCGSGSNSDSDAGRELAAAAAAMKRKTGCGSSGDACSFWICSTVWHSIRHCLGDTAAKPPLHRTSGR